VKSVLSIRTLYVNSGREGKEDRPAGNAMTTT
jgi:hypothetical protein